MYIICGLQAGRVRTLIDPKVENMTGHLFYKILESARRRLSK
jgi:hypothetical protein